jgi:hypothetical protein
MKAVLSGGTPALSSAPSSAAERATTHFAGGLAPGSMDGLHIACRSVLPCLPAHGVRLAAPQGRRDLANGHAYLHAGSAPCLVHDPRERSRLLANSRRPMSLLGDEDGEMVCQDRGLRLISETAAGQRLLATRANNAPCGSRAWTMKLPPGTGIGPCRMLPPPTLMRSTAASMASTLK